jgi:plasmid maintenance system antidote protein VapI
VTGDTALRLGHFFGNSPQFWLNHQATYDLRMAESKVGGEIRSLPTLNARRKKSAGRQALSV